MPRPVSAYASAYARRRVQSYMTATGRILRMGALSEDQVTGVVSSGVPTTLYTGKMRIWSVSASGVLVLGEADIDTRTTYVTIPFATVVPRTDDIVIVDDFGSDEDLETKTFRVIGVDGGGLTRASRRLTVVAWQQSREWDG